MLALKLSSTAADYPLGLFVPRSYTAGSRETTLEKCKRSIDSGIMNRAKLLAFIALAGCVTAHAQSQAPAPAPPPPGISPIKIGTVPDGPLFIVDGQYYTKAQTFAWPT